MADETYSIEFEAYEVSVASAALQALTERPDFDSLVPHAADRQALHDLLAMLEPLDPISFDSDYGAQLDAARKRYENG